MYFIGIDVSKFKHDCFIATEAESIKAFQFENNRLGFDMFLTILKSLDQTQEIRIGLEATGHYGMNLKQFICASGYTYLEFNPYLTHQFSKALTLRKTKTDKIDAKTISSMLCPVDYKTLHTSFYHINELKQCVRYRDLKIKSRAKVLVELTNILDRTFPELKSLFNHRLVPTFASTQTNIVDRMNSLQHNTTNTTVGFSAKRSGEADFFYPFAAKLQTEKII